jgi:hypothetical protein
MGGTTETVVQDTLDNTTNVVDTGAAPSDGDGIMNPRKQTQSLLLLVQILPII